MKNEYKCTYCTKTTCTTSIESPYDNRLEPEPKCIYHDGEDAEWVAVEAGGDDNKLQIALKYTEFMDGIEISGNNFKVSQFLSLREHLINALDRIKYLEGLEGE